MKIIKVIVVSIAVIVLLIAGGIYLVFSPPWFPEVIEDKFVSKDGSTVVTLENRERVRFGDETYIRVWVSQGGQTSKKHVVDHNGRLRMSKDYFLFVSEDRTWIRTCKPQSKPETGRLVWKTQAELWPHLSPERVSANDDFARGRWVVEPLPATEGGVEFTFHCDAYLNYKTDEFIRRVFPHSTREQRESLLFAPKSSGDDTDEINGKTVRWETLEKQG